MAVSAFPAVVDALITLAPGVVPGGVSVADGIPDSDDPADFLAVGLPSLSEQGSMFSGESQQKWADVGGHSRDEEGLVNCVAAARSTNETAKDARDRAFAIVEAVAGLCRANPTLGVSQVMWTSFGATVSPTLLYEAGRGVSYVVEFQVAYRARI